MDVTADRTDTRDHAAARPLSKVASTAFRTNRRGRRISVAGAVYIASWVAGLVLAPTTPVATASPDEIHRYYADEAPANRRAVLAHPRGRRPRARRARPHRRRRDRRLPALARVIRTSGVAAAVVSLLQVAFAVVGVATADSAAASTSARLFDDLNLADTAKLVLIAVFASSATTAAASAG